MTAEEAARSPLATTITRAIGTAAAVEPDLFVAELLPGDRLLMASDGLMRHVPDEEIARLVGTAGDLGEACRQLIELTGGAHDNVTCLLIEMG